MINLQKKPIGEMVQCPNCKQHTIPYSYEAGLLSDWCDSCDKSIFDDYSSVDPDHAAQELENNREQ
jgi:hypothetical protein